MANFDYNKFDLDKTLHDILGQNLDLEIFGLSDIDYFRVEEIEFEISQNKTNLTDDLVKHYGFDNITIFMDYYCRAHIWNNYSTNTTKTIRELLKFYYNKARKYHFLENIPIPNYDGNILDYLKQFKPNWLISIGW
jgi:hypothetical protein